MNISIITLAGIGFLMGFNLETIVKFIRARWQDHCFNNRIVKAINKWEKDIPYIKKCIDEDNKTLPVIPKGESYRPHRMFYWNQLVWQEIKMYIRLGKPVDLKEFIWLCDRRGFTLNERNYLKAVLQHVGLWKIKPGSAVGYNPPPENSERLKNPPPAPPKGGN